MARKSPHSLLLFIFLELFLQLRFIESTSFSLQLVRRKINYNMVPPFKKLNDYYFSKTICPPITRSHVLYTIDVKLGTPSKPRTLIFDTGGQLTWTLCTPANSSFNQTSPLFDPKKSRSYKKLPPNHSLARFFDCSNKIECTFTATYASGESSSGIASLETFNFPSNKWWSESIKDVVFGCSNNYVGQSFNPSINGIMGMNRSPLSLIGQLGTRILRRFSYCLPRLDSPVRSTFLRFGNDVKVQSNFQKTGFINPRNDYSVSLLNITVAGQLLVVPNRAFPSTCVVDIGSGASRIKMEAYNEVIKTLRTYFDRYNLTRVTSGQGDLCYKLRRGFRDYPNMSLHFDGAIFEIGPQKLFRFINDRFCLVLFGSQQMSYLGAYQMQDVRFVFDVTNDKLLFGQEDCSKDKA